MKVRVTKSMMVLLLFERCWPNSIDNERIGAGITRVLVIDAGLFRGLNLVPQETTEMGEIVFIYGSQELEVYEKAVEQVARLLPGVKNHQYTWFQYDAADLVVGSPSMNEKQRTEFRMNCDSVSFLAPEIVMQLNHIERIPTRKSPTQGIENDLKSIRLVATGGENTLSWFDADTVQADFAGVRQVTARQIVRRILPLAGKSFFLELDPVWSNQLIHLCGSDDENTLTINEFLARKLRRNISFDPPKSGSEPVGAEGIEMTELLQDYVKHPPSHVHFVFTAVIRQTREVNSAIFDLLNRKAKTIKTSITYDDFRPVGWIMERAQKKGIALDATIADLMIEIAGAELAILDMELNKLAILLPPGQRVTPSDLIENVSYSRRFSVFRVGDFLVRRDLKNTLESLKSVLKDQPADSLSVFGLIASQFRRLLKVAWLSHSGVPEKEIIARLKMNPWIGKQIIRHSSSFSLRELENITIQLAKLDLSVKYNAREAMMILENVCWQICDGALAGDRPLSRHWVP
jgi:DNA polymerase III delta subunit